MHVHYSTHATMTSTPQPFTKRMPSITILYTNAMAVISPVIRIKTLGHSRSVQKRQIFCLHGVSIALL
jgi:hypothetical protein